MLIQSLLAIVLVYPTAAREGTNLLAGARWTFANKEPSARAFTRTTGGPFSPEEPVWEVETFRQTHGYWQTTAPVRPGRRYLTGAWLRFENARTLFWTHGYDRLNGAHRDFRLYQFGGFQKCLRPYLSPEMTKRLCGNPNSWRLGYRYLTFENGLKDGLLQFDVGCYTCVGAMAFAAPFLVDVTDSTDNSLTVEIRDEKPVSQLELYRVGIRDTVWTHVFERPVTSARIKIPPEIADCRLGQEEDRNVIDGHGLLVSFADGSAETVFAPQEHCFRMITD